jgi:WD40 repeat protein
VYEQESIYPLTNFEFSPDGNYLAYSYLHRLKVWNLRAEVEPISIQAYLWDKSGFRFNPDGTGLIVDNYKRFLIWNIRENLE